MLRRHQRVQHIRNDALAQASGMSISGLAELRRGVPADNVMAKNGQKTITPGVNQLIKLAHGLDLKLSILLQWAEVTDKGDRFTDAERRALAEKFDCDPSDVEDVLRDLAYPNRRKEVAR